MNLYVEGQKEALSTLGLQKEASTLMKGLAGAANTAGNLAQRAGTKMKSMGRKAVSAGGHAKDKAQNLRNRAEDSMRNKKLEKKRKDLGDTQTDILKNLGDSTARKKRQDQIWWEGRQSGRSRG